MKQWKILLVCGNSKNRGIWIYFCFERDNPVTPGSASHPDTIWMRHGKKRKGGVVVMWYIEAGRLRDYRYWCPRDCGLTGDGEAMSSRMLPSLRATASCRSTSSRPRRVVARGSFVTDVGMHMSVPREHSAAREDPRDIKARRCDGPPSAAGEAEGPRLGERLALRLTVAP
jgi:hypothetical protein